MKGLRNVRIEKGWSHVDAQRVTTITELVDIEWKNGKIVRISEARGNSLEEGWLDGGGRLALPGISEKHVHLDKTYFGMPWKACIPASSVLERSHIEKSILEKAELPTEIRAENLFEHLISMGATSIRTQVDIYPEVGLSFYREVKKVAEKYPQIQTEIVAFAQHGFLNDETISYMRQAIAEGADFIGSVDPATVDQDIEKSLRTLLEMAAEGNVGVDIHLHDPGHLGTYTIERLAKLTCEYKLQGHVYVSHAFGLGDVSKETLGSVIQAMKEAEIQIITTVPIGRNAPPVDLLDKQGIGVYLGSDNIYDSWWPTGNGDLVERLGRLLEKNRWTNEKELAASLKFITDGITPLSEQGERLWPRVGQDATMILTPAQCTAEFIARRTPREVVIAKGVRIF